MCYEKNGKKNIFFLSQKYNMQMFQSQKLIQQESLLTKK